MSENEAKTKCFIHFERVFESRYLFSCMLMPINLPPPFLLESCLLSSDFIHMEIFFIKIPAAPEQIF